MNLTERIMKAVIPRSDVTGPLLKEIEDFARVHGRYYSEVLESLLDYIIFCFCIDHTTAPLWKYNQEDTEKFHHMMVTYFRMMEEALVHRSWYDMFGDLFMAWAGDKKYRGQCFTPMDMCDMMAHVTLDGKGSMEPTMRCRGFGKRVVVSDCACGSSRTLLAGHSVFISNGWRKPYLIGEDLDAMCCKMSAVNMLVHGCYGEVVCHNTLTSPASIMFGYVVNEGLYPFQPGLPTVRFITKPEQSVACMTWARRMQRARQMQQLADRNKPEDVLPVGGAVAASAESQKEKQSPMQLTLW